MLGVQHIHRHLRGLVRGFSGGFGLECAANRDAALDAQLVNLCDMVLERGISKLLALPTSLDLRQWCTSTQLRCCSASPLWKAFRSASHRTRSGSNGVLVGLVW